MNYWDSFGFEWTRFSRVQTGPEARAENEQTFRDKTGLTPDDVKGKLVLDVGCGAGRFLEVVNRWGARGCCAVEPSEAQEVARRNVPRANVFGVDLDKFSSWPEAHGIYDIVYCIGVLHHTPDPKQSFAAIARLVAPGGSLHVWVYGHMGPWDRIAQVYRKVTVHLPWSVLRAICLLAIPWGLLPKLGWPGRALWLLFPCSMHPKWRWRWLDTMDYLSPVYQSKHTVAEVKAWFLDAGFVDIQEGKVPVSVRGRKK